MPPVALSVTTPAEQLTLPGDRPAVVGRARDADIVISNPKVSRRHVSLEPTPDGWVARDLSTNGMWHDGAQVGSVRVGGDVTRLRLGGADGPEVVLAALVPAAAAPPAEPTLDELETRLAPSGGAPNPAQRAGRGATPAPVPAGAHQSAGVPAQRTAPAPVPSARRKPPRWLSTVPTLIWLFAAAFTIGALVALS
ncbi:MULTISPECIES: FHA domain-containing protein [Pseudofrankia]|uniref:FHA domain-containing protein n=1 Tax=Pseudofrankia TaxID=2994363 RepID=UPI000234DB81|nr:MULTISPECIES: FHA domain-containing protein [Pseudofrankia]OHV35664.1 forkhead-associated protein [Pseudofrankia sp. EUN1h]